MEQVHKLLKRYDIKEHSSQDDDSVMVSYIASEYYINDNKPFRFIIEKNKFCEIFSDLFYNEIKYGTIN